MISEVDSGKESVFEINQGFSEGFRSRFRMVLWLYNNECASANPAS